MTERRSIIRRRPPPRQAPARYPGQAGALRPEPMPDWVLEHPEALAEAPERVERPAPSMRPAPPMDRVDLAGLLADFEAQRRGALQHGVDSVMRGDGWPEQMPRFPAQAAEPPAARPMLERPSMATNEGGVPLSVLQGQNRMRDSADFSGYMSGALLRNPTVDPIAVSTRNAPLLPPDISPSRPWMNATAGSLPREDGAPAEDDLDEQWRIAQLRAQARRALGITRRAYGGD